MKGSLKLTHELLTQSYNGFEQSSKEQNPFVNFTEGHKMMYFTGIFDCVKMIHRLVDVKNTEALAALEPTNVAKFLDNYCKGQ